MLFSSSVFLYLFLPPVVFLYYVVFRWSRVAQNLLLLFASLFFYAWGEPKFVLIMIGSIIVNWFLGLVIDELRGKKKLCKCIVALDIILNLIILFLFKYLTFTSTLIRDVLGVSVHPVELALPIGISFFTFQAMSYVIDVYRQDASVQTNLFCVGLYISFFPQLIAGPIVRYQTIEDQILNRKETLDDFCDGFSRFVIGLSKKALLANNFAILADQAFNANERGALLSVGFCWLGAIAYTLQIYYDFSGYSDMAIGLGKMFGFHFLENFDYPYISSSITEFWRRWHISLGTWFRDYLYIPLGGSRCKTGRNILNLFLVWLLTGLWHGANITFIVWGLMYFCLLLFERYSRFGRVRAKFLKWGYTMFFVIVGWVIFRASSIRDASAYLQQMYGLVGNPVIDGVFTGWLSQNLTLMVAGIILSTPVIKSGLEKYANCRIFNLAKAIVLSYLFVMSIASLVSNLYNPFIYFHF